MREAKMLENYEDVLKAENMCKILHDGKNTAYQLLQDDIISFEKIEENVLFPNKASLIIFCKYKLWILY